MVGRPGHVGTAAGEFLAEPNADAVYRKVKRRILPVLVICYLVAFIDRSNIGIAKLQFTVDLGWSDAVFGLGATFFYVGYILFEVPSNLFLRRFGVRKTFLRIMITWGLAAAAAALMVSPWHFYVLRFLLGVFEAGFFPGVLLYLTYWIPVSRRGRVTATFMASLSISGLIGGPISGAIMHVFDGVGGWQGWQWMFVIEGLPACILGVVVYFVLSDGPASANWLRPAERELITRDLASEAGTARTVHSSIRNALRSSQFYALAVMALGIMTSTNGLFLWAPTIIRNAGVTSALNVGLVSAVPFAIGIVVQYLIARRSDRTLERRWHAGGCAVAGAVSWFVLPAVAGDPALAILVLTVATTGTLAAMGPFWTMPSALLSGTAAAAGIAGITAVAGVGNVFTPVLTGWLASHTGSLSSGQLVYGTLLGIGAITLIAVVKPFRTDVSV